MGLGSVSVLDRTGCRGCRCLHRTSRSPSVGRVPGTRGTQPPPTLLLQEAEGRGTARWWPARLTGPGVTSRPSRERESEASGVSRAEPLGHHHAALSRTACGGCGLGHGPELCQGQRRTMWPARPIHRRFPHLPTQNEHRLQMSFIPVSTSQGTTPIN